MNKEQLFWWLSSQPTDKFIKKILSCNPHGVLSLNFDLTNRIRRQIRVKLKKHHGVDFVVDDGRKIAVVIVHLDWWSVINRVTGIEPVRLCFEGIENWECKGENTSNGIYSS